MTSSKTGYVGWQFKQNKLAATLVNRPRKSFIAKTLMGCITFTVLGVATASDFSINPVYFVEGKPSSHDKLADSLILFNESVEVLKNDAAAISTLQGKFRVKIVGFTDNKECAGPECLSLSVRRAKAVYAWMLTHGVSSSLLFPPEGKGSNDPLDDNNTPEGRARNRHVEFQMIPVQKK